MKKSALTALMGLLILSAAAAQDAREILNRADRSFELDRVYSESSLTVYKKRKAPVAPAYDRLYPG